MSMTHFRCEFNGSVHFMIRLTIFGNSFVFMYVYALYIIFQCESSGNSDYVIWRPYCHNIWYGHHQASFFSVNPTVTVIMSSRDHIVIIYDMVITKHHFSVPISCDGDYGIWRLYFDNIWYGYHSIQDKEVHLNTMSRPRSKTRKPT